MKAFLQSTTDKNRRYQILSFDEKTRDMKLKSVGNGVEFPMPNMSLEEIKRLDYAIETVASE